MTVLSPAAGDLFRVTVIKHHINNPDRKWANNYEVRCKAAGDVQDLNTMAMKLVTFEQGIHYNVVRFVQCRISTWEEDSVPYDPASFSSLPLNALGAYDPSTNDVLALNVCLDVRRVPISGRYGHLFYRGALVEPEVRAPAGKYVLTDSSVVNTRISTFVTSSGVADLLDGTDINFELAMINKTGTQVREVIGLSPGGVATVAYDHKWFNRTSGGA